MRRIIFLFCFISSLGLQAQNYTGSYDLSLKFNEQGFTYSNEKSKLTLDGDGNVVVSLDYKMVDPKTATTNYALATGNGTGSLKASKATITGNVSLLAIEKGSQTDQLNYYLEMSGDFTIVGDNSVFKGTFKLIKEGEVVTGTVTGKCPYSSTSTLTISRGSYKIKRSGSDDWKTGQSGGVINAGDIIETSDDSRINLTFPDGTLFKIKSNTYIELQNDAVKLKVGEVWFQLLKQGREFQVVTPSSSTGTYGTTFIVSVDASEKSFVSLLEGKIYVKNNDGKKTIMEAGQSMTVTSEGVMSEPGKIDTASVSAKFESSDDPSLGESGTFSSISNQSLIIIGASAVVVILFVLVFLVVRKRKKKSKKQSSPVTVSNTQASYIPPIIQPSHVVQNITVVDQQKNANPPAPISSAAPKAKFCTDCGAKLKDNARFCHNCAKAL